MRAEDDACAQEVRSTSATSGKPVFFHYMIGEITAPHCEKDVKDALALGVDAFILNIDTVTASWATGTVKRLFDSAAANNFKLLFSFDMKGYDHPNKFINYLLSYVDNPAYYKYNGKPMVTTFNGGGDKFKFGQGSVNDGWKTQLQQVMANAGKPIYFVPAFADVGVNADFFTKSYPTLDGAMNWEGAWPGTGASGEVPTKTDTTLLSAAHSSQKTMMMGVSPLQFKHLDKSNNWYRRGEQNLEKRFAQVLSMQPDMIEMITWNDAGESHYMGNSWPEPLSTSTIGTYTKDYDHTGYWQILPAFFQAYKRGETTTGGMVPTNGKSVQGTFWHHTLLAAGTCPNDVLSRPNGATTIEDRVSGVILVAAGQTGLSVTATSGSKNLGTQALNAGYNSFSFTGMTTGTVNVKVVGSNGASVVQGSGKIAVTNQAAICNYNFQVVGLA
ncbi:hypothetical protein HYFRA_00009183 [Hymenoscyphus fraxineus]|uniref:Glycoside hydrolase family 71 protein n=1 Tax=Hymenoscyphus fraxineus TaxID=746836 RepID=A0A9N9PNZ2_9HELO|nr:hypothetical protein HYFRA_00009183 [Hymenoscyphus fraxineus]